MTALIALTLAQASVTASCAAHVCDADRLRPYFDKLAEARRGRRTVRIVQIGDSHTAGDQITGSWRTALQARYGSAGRGVLPPGRPYQGYLTRGITAAQSPGWSVDGIFGAAWHGGAGEAPRGLSAYSLSSGTPGASLSLVADPGEEFDRFTVCAIRAPGAGGLTLAAGGQTQPMPLEADAAGPGCETLTLDAPTTTAALTVTQGRVTVTSWSTERADAGGVTLSNLGTVGAQLTHFARVDDRVLRAELREYRPDLLVVAFGTNEAFAPDFTAAGLEAVIRAQIARLKRFAPGVPVLLLGAPDSGTKRADLRGGAGCGALNDLAPPTAALAPAPLLPDELVEPLPPPNAAFATPWSPTVNLSTVQLVQRRLAHELGLAFWDWSGAMGGRCAANRWTALQPPLMRPDHVHFTTLGGREIARRLQDDLDAAARRVGNGERGDAD